ncbi:hypothetical protein Nepgr_002742 [Nepenthes gracilis]|uniref:Uncharacterized protein n=1 Tax=Nepenthes gracilis TaxID=150966 RepID=A0AAD3RYF4_NEPGR|nr:hypothetical protein Nepgr_002742 [Nepenthes gracilis]
MLVNRVDRLNEGGPAFFEELASQQFDRLRHIGKLAHERPERLVLLVLEQPQRHRGKRRMEFLVGRNGRRTQWFEDLM